MSSLTRHRFAFEALISDVAEFRGEVEFVVDEVFHVDSRDAGLCQHRGQRSFGAPFRRVPPNSLELCSCNDACLRSNTACSIKKFNSDLYLFMGKFGLPKWSGGAIPCTFYRT